MFNYPLAREPEQFRLFDLGLNLTTIRAAKEKLMKSTRALNTVKAYAHCWAVFCCWCESAGRASLPASSDTLELFVTWAVTPVDEVARYRVATVEMTLSAIKDRHRQAGFGSPVDANVRLLIHNAVRSEGPAVKKRALTPQELLALCSQLGMSAREVRDRAMLVLGFATFFRRSEIVALHLIDVRFDGEDLVLHLRRSKGDQKGEGRFVRIQPGAHELTCPVRQVRAWLKVRGLWSGSLFCRIRGYGHIVRVGLQGRVVCEAVQKGVARNGADPSAVGGHSIRAGGITASAENGASVLAIRERSGHKSLDVLAGYVRTVGGSRSNPLAGVL